jgi:hypothetical protein
MSVVYDTIKIPQKKGLEMDEQAAEIRQDLEDYYANPEDYTLSDFEEIFQDRDPFEFL